MNFKAENKRIAKLIEVGLEKLSLGEAENALLEFEAALFFDSESLAANCLAATCLSRLGQPIEAEALALKACELAPDLALPHLIASEILKAAGKSAEAEFHLLEAVSREPYNAELRIELARTRQRIGGHGEAEPLGLGQDRLQGPGAIEVLRVIHFRTTSRESVRRLN